MSFFDLKTNPKEGQYARLVSDVLRTLQTAVSTRVADGHSRSEIAGRISMHPTQLSRILNARVGNVTLRTISDVLWACDFEPTRFSADPVEEVSPNAHRNFEGINLSASPSPAILRLSRIDNPVRDWSDETGARAELSKLVGNDLNARTDKEKMDSLSILCVES